MNLRFFQNLGPFTVQEIANHLNIDQIEGDDNKNITSLNSLKSATSSEISFFDNFKYEELFYQSSAGAFIVNSKIISKIDKNKFVNNDIVWLISSNSYRDYKYLLDLFFIDKYKGTISPGIDKNASIGKNCTFANDVTISSYATIGDNCTIMSNGYIGPNVSIGDNVIIGPNVVISHSIIQNDCLFHPGVKIGQDGFGFCKDEKGNILKIMQVGGVLIGDNVEVGANSCIDRGAMDDTIIQDNVKLDNLVQIGHNAIIGENTLIAGQTAIAGSTTIGKNCMIGGQVGVAGHLTIGNNVHIAGQSGVIQNVTNNAIIGGTPAVPLKQWHMQSAFLAKSVKSFFRGKESK